MHAHKPDKREYYCTQCQGHKTMKNQSTQEFWAAYHVNILVCAVCGHMTMRKNNRFVDEPEAIKRYLIINQNFNKQLTQ